VPICTVNLPLVPLAVGDVVDRSAWVPHVTLIGNFRVPDGAGDIAAAVLRHLAAATGPARAVLTDEAWFGPDASVLVDLLEAPRLHELHRALLDALESTIDGFTMLLPTHTRDGYRPHRTVAAGPRPRPGDGIEAGAVALVELEPEGRPGMAVVLAAFELGGGPAVGSPVGPEDVHGVLAALDAEGVRSWVIGGWGVDALAGAQSRPHHDLDLFVDADRIATAIDALAGRGFVVRFVWSENRWSERGDGRLLPSAFVAVDAAGREVDVHTLRVVDGHVSPVSAAGIELPAGALEATGTIGARPVPCASADGQLVMHTGYPLPERQVADVALLRS
jgi:lincosamide nucleotidyltransferase A/C/D/E